MPDHDVQEVIVRLQSCSKILCSGVLSEGVADMLVAIMEHEHARCATTIKTLLVSKGKRQATEQKQGHIDLNTCLSNCCCPSQSKEGSNMAWETC